MPMNGIQPKGPETDAEKIANAQDSIKQATLALEKIQKRLDDPEGEYTKAEADFGGLNVKLKEAEAMVVKLRKDGKEAEAKALEATLPALQADWQLAKERFDIAIRQKKASLEAIEALKQRIASDQQLLNRLEGKEPPKTTPAPPTVVTPAPAPAPPMPVAPPDPNDKNTKTTPDFSGLAKSGVPGMPGLPGTTDPGTAHAPVPSAPILEDADPVVRQARALWEQRKAELHEIEERLRVAEERVRVMENSIQTAQKILALDRESVVQAEKSAARLSETLRSDPPAEMGERDAMAQKLMETEERLHGSRDRAKRITDRLDEFNVTLAELKAERDVIFREAEAKRAQVEEAEAALNTAQNPMAPRKIMQWLGEKGPRLLLIIVGMVLVHLGVRQFSRHIVRFITRHSDRGSKEDRENRANTLVGVFRYVAGLGVFGGGIVMLLDEVGVPIVPLMGGAAVLGLAVAFGAQNLIRDYFTGFMMLMEDQYSVNDVVRIGSIAGLVEQISLRMTVLRDLEGVRHFIPHGTITSVSNLTHGWSRALFDISVAYKENVDRVIEVLMQLGREMRLDPVLGKHILDNPEMLGVDALGDSGVIVRFLLKTRPLKQWPIKREMLRRIKNRFDELGIEIPFPHRTVYHHFSEGNSSSSLLGDLNNRSVA